MICKVCGEQKLDKRATSAEIPPITHTPTDWNGPIWVGFFKRAIQARNLSQPSLLFQFKYNEQNES